MDQPIAKKRVPYKSLQKEDLIALYEFFEAPEIDHSALADMIAERFEDSPVLLKTCKRFAGNVRRIEAGREPNLDLQSMVAKSVLSLMINMGRLGVAKKFLAACVEQWGIESYLEVHTMLTLAGAEIERLDVLDKTWLDYQVYDRGAETTFIVFCGYNHRFGVELNSVIPWLRTQNVNLIYLRDFCQRLYLAGIQSVGDLEESLSRLKRDLQAMGTKRIVAIGSSGGTYGALNYCHRLGGDEVLCFAGPTSLQAGVLEASQRPVYARIEEMIAAGEVVAPDLRAGIEQSGIRVRYFYGKDYLFDAVQTKTLEGLPTVTHEGLDDWSRHVVIGELARRGLLKGIFAQAATG